jgi:hypothetical protein
VLLAVSLALLKTLSSHAFCRSTTRPVETDFGATRLAKQPTGFRLQTKPIALRPCAENVGTNWARPFKSISGSTRDPVWCRTLTGAA